MSAEDNLVKGASGQAVQSMNILCGFPGDGGIDLIAGWKTCSVSCNVLRLLKNLRGENARREGSRVAPPRRGGGALGGRWIPPRPSPQTGGDPGNPRRQAQAGIEAGTMTAGKNFNPTG